VSVAVGYSPGNGDLVDRATISDLTVWDLAARRFVNLESGLVLRACHISSGLSIGLQDRPVAYAAEFVLEGRTYRCALYRFLPRTRVVSAEEALILPAADALSA
jgi:hypothetical protein